MEMPDSEDSTDPVADTSPAAQARHGAQAPPEALDASSRPDSGSFLRCSDCAHGEGLDDSAGTLFCRKHNMHINAEADEIPDDCIEFEARTPRRTSSGNESQ